MSTSECLAEKLSRISDWCACTGRDMQTRSLAGSIEGYGHKLANYASEMHQIARLVGPTDLVGRPIPELPEGDKKFDVHLWFPVRVKITGVAADSQLEAVDRAEASIDLEAFEALIDRHLYVISNLHPGEIIDVEGDTEEGALEALVDYMGPDGTQFDEDKGIRCDSKIYPYAQLCQKLVAWNDSGRPADALQEILKEAKTVDLRVFPNE